MQVVTRVGTVGTVFNWSSHSRQQQGKQRLPTWAGREARHPRGSSGELLKGDGDRTCSSRLVRVCVGKYWLQGYER